MTWLILSFPSFSSTLGETWFSSSLSNSGRNLVSTIHHLFTSFSFQCMISELLICYCSVTNLCLILGNSMDSSPLGSSVHGISQARVLEWVAIYFSRGSSQLRDWTQVPCIASRFFTWATFFFSSVSLSAALIIVDNTHRKSSTWWKCTAWQVNWKKQWKLWGIENVCSAFTV